MADLNVRNEVKSEVLQFFSIFIFRRMTFILILVFLFSYPLIQILLLSLQSICMIVYLCRSRPFKSSVKMKLEILNEILLFLCILCLGVLWMPSLWRWAKFLGWASVFFTVLCIIVNTLAIVPADGRRFCRECKTRCRSKAEAQRVFQTKLSKLKLAWNQTETHGIRRPPRLSSRKVLIHPDVSPKPSNLPLARI